MNRLTWEEGSFQGITAAVAQPSRYSMCRRPYHLLDVVKTCLRQVVEVHQSMLELPTPSGLLDDEPDFL